MVNSVYMLYMLRVLGSFLPTIYLFLPFTRSTVCACVRRCLYVVYVMSFR